VTTAHVMADCPVRLLDGGLREEDCEPHNPLLRLAAQGEHVVSCTELPASGRSPSYPRCAAEIAGRKVSGPEMRPGSFLGV
jgi:hypothetical protein